MSDNVIKLDMTWRMALTPLLAVYEDGTPKGRAQALSELIRMANAADAAVRSENVRKAGPKSGDLDSCLETIWDALTSYRSDLIPEGDPRYDAEWDEIATAMAFLTEMAGGEAGADGEGETNGA